MVKKQASKKSASSRSSGQPRQQQQQQQRPLDDEEAPVSTSTSTNNSNSSLLDLKHQQRLLDVFSEAFGAVLSSADFPVLLQEIKQALFNRDFDAAFGREEYLQAYAARWSPTRALCYASVLHEIGGYIDQIALPAAEEAHDSLPSTSTGHHHETLSTAPTEDDKAQVQEISSVSSSSSSSSPSSSSPTSLDKRIKMLSIGGCAAEHVAFASHLHDTSSRGSLALLDSAPWSQVTAHLQAHLTTPPAISKYASAAVRASNRALLLDQQLSLAFSQNDVQAVARDELAALVGTEPLVVTLLFTLNELYTNGGIGKTTKFLRTLGELLPHGSLLLVVDSPGSYSEAAVGKEKKRYPMQWLLNHTLLEPTTKAPAQDYKWERLESHDSIWFRLPDGLSYPIQLENMRYQMHLYRRESIS